VSPDVPASRLRRGQLTPDAARVRYIVTIPADPKGQCQICDTPAPLHVLEPVVDRTNGQRTSIALCDPCVVYLATRDPEAAGFAGAVLERPRRPRRRRSRR
jgi:hypothetical protein